MEETILFATEPLERAVFLERPNRFMVRVQRRPQPPRGAATSSRHASQRTTLAHIGNPGRMGEILLPGTEVLLAHRPHTASRWEAVRSEERRVGKERSGGWSREHERTQ